MLLRELAYLRSSLDEHVLPLAQALAVKLVTFRLEFRRALREVGQPIATPFVHRADTGAQTVTETHAHLAPS